MANRIDFVGRLRTELVDAAANRCDATWRSRIAKGGRYSPQRLVTGLVLAALLIAGVSVPLVLFSRGVGAPDIGSSVRPGAEPIQGKPALAANTQLPRGVVDVLVAYGAVWAAAPNGVVRVDPATNKVVITVRVTGMNGDQSQLAAGEGSIWVTHGYGNVTRIDPVNSLVSGTFSIGRYVRDIAIGGGFAWVTRTDEGLGQVVKIDPATNLARGKPVNVGEGVGPIAYLDDFIWVTNTESGEVRRIDPVSGASSLTQVSQPEAEAAGALWSTAGDQVVRQDPSTGEIVATIAVERAALVAAEAGHVWVLTAAGSTDPDIYLPDPDRPATMVLIDPATNATVGSAVSVGFTPASIGAGMGSVWVANYDTGVLSRIEVSE